MAAARARTAALLAVILPAGGCATLAPSRFVDGRTAPPAEVARRAAAEPAPPPAPAEPAAPPPSPAPAAPRSIPELVARALEVDPATRAAWHDVRAAAAAAGGERTAYLPSVSVGAGVQRAETARTLTRAGTTATTAGPSGELTWILLDLGARAARVDQADQLLLASRLAEHAAVADLVLRVQETAYQYLGSRALAEAEAAAVKQAEESLAAAEGRRGAGVATVADVLQARTALSQARLRLQQVEGQALTVAGALATLAGLPPTATLDLGALPADVRVPETSPAVEALLDEAARRSPDLARARAQAGAAAAGARAAERAWLPVLSLNAAASRSWYLDPSGVPPSSAWTVGLSLRVPLLEGLLRPAYDALAARAAADAAEARAAATGQAVALQVWTGYQAFRSAGLRVETARDLLASARASSDVAAGRYREGVGSILDLLTAQAALEGARAEEVRARADYLVALAQLARATGRLALPAPAAAPAPPAPAPEGNP
ncbi:TolC family protein [Anaeromyxobacter sp. Red801]|uniref:TolC family protein n=1 Tax=Anaeromyxobacter sp. Red801 TaxID=3411632 RepID=UPI003BA11950